MDFSERLKFLRLEASVTQEDLAQAIHVRRPAISGYETKNQQPDFDRLCLIADFFNVSLDYLLGRSAIRNSNETASSTTFSLTADENSLMKIYTALTERNQAALLERGQVLLETQEQETMTYNPSAAAKVLYKKEKEIG